MALTITIVGIGILGLILFFILRKGAAPTKQTPAARPVKASATTQFHAVSIKYAASACSAAKSLEGKRYLSNAAPRLPLPDCDASGCKCRFVHHADRREGDERRNAYRGGIAGDTGKHQEEKRQGPPDRRGRPQKI